MKVFSVQYICRMGKAVAEETEKVSWRHRKRETATPFTVTGWGWLVTHVTVARPAWAAYVRCACGL